MKKILLSTLALATLSSTVYASKARIMALGDESEDNFYIEDSRRIFTNVAQIHNYKNTVMAEWGNEGAASGALDADSNPKAMGGFISTCGNMVCGAYLGNESNISSSLRIIATDLTKTTGAALKTADNQVDLFLGGDMGSTKWAANFLYSASEDKTGSAKSEDSAMAARFGMLATNWEGYVNLSLKSDSKAEGGYKLNGTTAITADQKFDGKLGVQVGGHYKMGSNADSFFAVKKFDWEQGATTKTDGGFLSYRAGYGYKLNVTDSSWAFVRGYYESIKIELEKSGTAKAELTRTKLPLIVGYESKATSWLTLRGSVIHDVMGKVKAKQLASYLTNTGTALDSLHETIAYNYNALVGSIGSGTYFDGEKSLENTTTVNAGATLTFGNLEVDGFVGTTGVARNSTTQAKNGVLSTDNLLTRVGMTYKF